MLSLLVDSYVSKWLMWRLGFSFVVAGALGGAIALAPAPADACGGTFCDAALPTEMPVDQTGETILFAIDNGFVEAHIQIEYDGGDAEEFAWLVPIPEVPEIEVGSWRLVQAALDGTVPVYGYEDNQACEDDGDDGSNSTFGFTQRPDGGGGGGPTVVAEDVAGAFAYAILQGGTAETVTQWLQDNGYAVQDEAPSILDDYITEGHVFVAFRLRHGQGVEDIHPVVIRYPGVEPCIPIRLTRVAAQENMDIRAMILGESRVVPTNFREVLLNRTRLDWIALGANYKDLVTMAVDAPGADGRAFVTEYAGPTEAIDGSTLDTSTFDPQALVGVSVVDVIEVLEGQDVLDCTPEGCLWLHELAPSLVHEFIPVPDGLEDGEFYSCLTCYAGLIDMGAWDSDAFIAAYEERIVAPLDHGAELLETWPYVTRLYTTISPHEMTSDPMFAENPELPDVASRHGAQRNLECCGTSMRLPGGRLVWLDGAAWPLWERDMPWAEQVIEHSPGGGAPVVLLDNTATIDGIIETWNAQANCEEAGDSSGDGSTETGPGDAGTSQGADAGGTTGGQGTTGGAASDDGEVGGCGCRSTAPGSMGLWMLLGLGLGAVRRRST